MDVPTYFGHDRAYRIESLLGRGGFATVHKAYQASLDRYVAIKVLRSEVVENDQAIERFQREARVAARLSSHPNIVTIFDCGEQDGRAYLILEFVDGITLEDRLAKPFTASEIVHIVTSVGSALDYAHAHQLVHRDVKPSNVLLGHDGRVLLSDFGIAKLLDTVNSVTGSVLGTVEYMSPEQIVGAPLDGRSDVYAMGAMAYRLFAGRPPFHGSMTSVMYKHVHEEPPPLDVAETALPPDVETVLRKALEKNAADRYPTAGDLAAEIARALRPATLVEQAHQALAGNQLDRAERITSELVLGASDDSSGRYVSGRVQRLREVIQVARLLDGGDLGAAHDLIDRLRLRQSSQPEIQELVRRADSAGAFDSSQTTVAGAPPPVVDRPSTDPRGKPAGADSPPGGYTRLVPKTPADEPETRIASGSSSQMRPPQFGASRDTPTGETPSGQRRLPTPPISGERGYTPRPPLVPATRPTAQPTPPGGFPAQAASSSRTRTIGIAVAALVVLLLGGLLAWRTFSGGAAAPTAGTATPTTTVAAAKPTAAPAQQPAATGPTTAPAVGGQPGGSPATATGPTPGAAPSAPGAASAPSPAPSSPAPPAAASQPAQAASKPAAANVQLAPPLAHARHLHTATRLDDGRILVVGGRDGMTALNTAEIYDPKTNAWTPTANMSTARYRQTATLLPGGMVLVVGGQGGDGNFLDTAEKFDPASGAWSPAGKLSVARGGHTATLLDDGRVLVVGGYNTTQFHNTAELYDPRDSAWSAAATLADIHSGHTATRLKDGTVLVAGGFGSTTQATIERYDPKANTWASAGSMKEGRTDQTAVLLNDGRVLVAGGVNSQNGGTYLATAEIFDPASGAWSPAASMAGPRSGHTAALLPNGQVLVAGGRDAETSLSSAERYEPAGNAWAPAGTLVAARWLPASALLPDGRLLLSGGRVGNSSLAFVEQYDPARNEWAGEGQTLTLSLTSQNNSGITGTVVLTNIGGGKLRVEMHAVGAGPGPYPAHIHMGSCAQLNPAPRFPLTNVLDGVSITEIDASLQLVTSSPNAIHMHKSPDEMPIYVACADTRVPG
ncbi:MAG: kelch repeat-containing protein [Chloroflexota bacterium]